MTQKKVLLIAVFILGTGFLSLRANVLRLELQGSYFRLIIKDVLEKYLDCSSPRCRVEQC
jgi:hypothetical protein